MISVHIIMCCLGVSFKLELFHIANELCFHLLCPRGPDMHVKQGTSVERHQREKCRIHYMQRLAN